MHNASDYGYTMGGCQAAGPFYSLGHALGLETEYCVYLEVYEDSIMPGLNICPMTREQWLGEDG
jgi:hypothetical protein